MIISPLDLEVFILVMQLKVQRRREWDSLSSLGHEVICPSHDLSNLKFVTHPKTPEDLEMTRNILH